MWQGSASEPANHHRLGGTLSRREILRGLTAMGIVTASLRNTSAFVNNEQRITEFTFHAPQSALDDLKRRLAQVRWPEGETVADWSQGVPLTKLRALVDYWRSSYDWRRFEARLNALTQYRTEIDGLNIHFLHVRSRHANTLPIIITHGWPGSGIAVFNIIRPPTNS